MPPKPTIATLSRTRRRVYFRLLVSVFVLAVPLLFLYATGYRFDTLTGLMETGGIYVGAEQADAEIYINCELLHETGTFRRAFFIQDLKPGRYTIAVSKEGYHPWGKTLPVLAHRVTEAQAFNMPKEPVLTLIPLSFTTQTTNRATTTATSTVLLSNPVYEAINTAFATTTATTSATGAPLKVPSGAVSTSTSVASVMDISTTTKTFRGMQIYDAGKHIVARWTRDGENIPFYFCELTVAEVECPHEIVLNTKEEKPSHFDFFPGTTDLVIVTLKDGIYVTELDNRSGQNIQPLYLTPGADFRVIDGGIYVKVDARIYKVEI